MILFGLGGGIGNCLFALPAFKALSRHDQVSLVVDADYDCVELFSRCVYVKKVYSAKDKLPKADRYLTNQYVPAAFRGKPVEFCGYPRGTSVYAKPEWAQIKGKACGNEEKEDVSGWIKTGSEEKNIDFALIPCGKPGDEWSRKRWPGFHSLARTLESRGYSVRAFGQRQEISDSGLLENWSGHRNIQDLVEYLRKCRVAVCNDCGIGHLASSLGVRSVFIFTSTSVVKGQPLGWHKIISNKMTCSPCQSTPRWAACQNWQCRDIAVEVVAAEAEKMLLSL